MPLWSSRALLSEMLMLLRYELLSLVLIFTCVALAKAGLVMGPLRPSVRPQHFRGTKFV